MSSQAQSVQDHIVGERLAGVGHGPANGFAAALLRAFDALGQWHDRRAQRRALARLDDRMLKDIGLTRGEVEFETAKPFWLS